MNRPAAPELEEDCNMFNVVPARDVPGFRVGMPEETPGFRVNADGSVGPPTFGGVSNVPAFIADEYGSAFRRLARPDPFADDGVRVDPATEEWAAARPLTCAAAHRACIDSGRPPELCLRALYNCSQNGVPTIFAPGIWGAPS